MLDQDFDLDVRAAWLEDVRKEARESNPLFGYCERVVIVRTTCRRRKNHRRAGTRRKYVRNDAVELLRFLPSRRCVQVKDVDTPGLDALANEIFAGKYVPPDIDIRQYFLDYFRKL